MQLYQSSNASPDTLRPRIDVSNAAELRSWADKFGVSADDVLEAVRLYGPAADAVQLGLQRRPERTT